MAELEFLIWIKLQMFPFLNHQLSKRGCFPLSIRSVQSVPFVLNSSICHSLWCLRVLGFPAAFLVLTVPAIYRNSTVAIWGQLTPIRVYFCSLYLQMFDCTWIVRWPWQIFQLAKFFTWVEFIHYTPTIYIVQCWQKHETKTINSFSEKIHYCVYDI